MPTPYEAMRPKLGVGIDRIVGDTFTLERDGSAPTDKVGYLEKVGSEGNFVAGGRAVTGERWQLKVHKTLYPDPVKSDIIRSCVLGDDDYCPSGEPKTDGDHWVMDLRIRVKGQV